MSKQIKIKKLTPRIKQLALKRLGKTLKELKSLPAKNFNYSVFVSKMNKTNECGTVCCVAGWYPKWHKQAGLSWNSRLSDLVVTRTNFNDVEDIDTRLAEFHGLGMEIINYLFYGYSISIYSDHTSFLEVGHLNLENAKKVHAVHRFETLHNLMAKNLLPDDYYYDSIQEPAK